MEKELKNEKELEFNELYLEIKQNEDYFKTLNHNNIEEIVFFSAKKIKEIFDKNNFKELKKQLLNNKPLLIITFKMLLNNVLKISIEKDFFKKNIKIELVRNFNYPTTEFKFNIYNNTNFDINNIISIQNNKYMIKDKNFNLFETKNNNLNIYIEEKIGMHYDIEDFDLVKVFIIENQLNYLYELEYNNQLFFQEEVKFIKRRS
jgi:hypothetical protein